MSGVLSGRVGKKRASRPRGQVLRMMAIMQDGNSGEVPKEFLEGGRTGRRNAMPDILNEPDAHATTADLPARLQELATNVRSPEFDDGELNEAMPSCTPCCNDPAKPYIPFNAKDVGTTVSDHSGKHCCSSECLNEFLRSPCAQRRNAIACVPECIDPKNPQPGPSNQSGSSSDKDDAQKGSGS